MATYPLRTLILATALAVPSWALPAFAAEDPPQAVIAVPEPTADSAAIPADEPATAVAAIAAAADKPVSHGRSAGTQKRAQREIKRGSRPKPLHAAAHRRGYRVASRPAYRVARNDFLGRGCYSLGCRGYTIVGVGF